MKENCPEGSGGAACPLEDVLARRYATLRAGAFDLSFPLDFFGDKRSGEIEVVVQAVLDLQGEWFKRFAREPATLEAAQKDMLVLTDWVDGWSKGDLKKVSKGEGGSLFDLMEAGEGVREASARLAPMIYDEETMAVTPQFIQDIRMVFCPTRLSFMEMVGYGGMVSPAVRQSAWHSGTAEWTQLWIDQTMVVALEYSPWTDDPKFQLGMSMNKFDKQGQRQFVVQQAAAALLTKTLNRMDLPLLDKGLAVHMTIAVCGAANTIDGEGSISSTGATTAPYERFVPGGNSNGGTLPAIPAIGFDSIQESHWRKTKSGGLFFAALEAGQKQGGKRAKKDNKRDLFKRPEAHFELTSPTGKHIAVTAPFLGQPATQRPYPEPEYLNDYREFFRSYQACFLDWLRNTGSEGDSEEVARGKFQQLLSKLSLEREVNLDNAVQEIYQEPLTTLDGSAGLEWRFLTWLEDQ
ncbi:hypothetical protein [Planctomycetes bacterium Poly30]|uniref:hypothetical protein n=1 Tax=Saltatorellus ferox TaxID=2528018 RepID=UPI0011A0A578